MIGYMSTELFCWSVSPFLVFEGLMNGSWFCFFCKLKGVEIFGIWFYYAGFGSSRHGMDVGIILRRLWQGV